MNNETYTGTKNDDFSIGEKVYIADIASLKEQVRSLQVKLFGRSSEANITLDDKQLNLFDTA